MCKPCVFMRALPCRHFIVHSTVISPLGKAQVLESFPLNTSVTYTITMKPFLTQAKDTQYLLRELS